jgi:hypothetical protein
MLTPPDGLRTDLVVSALAAGWDLDVARLDYLPLGFGSHHWEAVDTAGTRWFVTIDELNHRRWSQDESADDVAGRLAAALRTAVDLSELGLSFAHAPIPARGGGPLPRMSDDLVISLYPFVTGRAFSWGEFSSPEHRRAVLDLVIAVHTAPQAARRHARTDDLTITYRDALDAALDHAEGASEDAGSAGHGPYQRPASLLIAAHAGQLRHLLARYDALAARAKGDDGQWVLTHGEPHQGNTMLTEAGWLLIDWDTALIAPPERDLSVVDPGDGSMLAAYQRAAGVRPRPYVVDLYRLRWELTDIAMTAGRFRQRHTGNADDQKSFTLLAEQLDRLAD